MGNEILDPDMRSVNAELDGFAQIRLPKDTSVLTTGIIALPFSLGLIGIILSIVTLVNASSSLRLYNAEPEKYLESSVKKVRAGKVCAIVSLSIFGVGILALIGILATNA